MCVCVCERQNERVYGFMMHVFTMCLRERDLLFRSPLRPQSPGSPKPPPLFLSLRFVFPLHVCVFLSYQVYSVLGSRLMYVCEWVKERKTQRVSEREDALVLAVKLDGGEIK